MASTFFGDLYNEAEQGVAAASVPAGTYDVEVSSARPREESSLIFLTLKVLNGPAEGQEADVNVFFPREDTKRGARIYFAKKIAGLIAYPDVKSAFAAADTAPDRASGFELISSALIGKQVVADLGLRTDGDYAGSNELRSTKPMGDNLSTPAQPQAPAVSASQNSTPAVAAATTPF